MPKSFKQKAYHLIFLLVSFSIGIVANCQVDPVEELNSDAENQLVTAFAKNILPPDYFGEYNWGNIKKVNAKDSIMGWVIKPLNRSDTMFLSFFLRAEGNIPVDIVENKITSKIPAISQKDGFNLTEVIKKGQAPKLNLAQYSFVHRTKRVRIFPEENKVFNKEEYEQTKISEPLRAAEMLPDILIYGGGNPPRKRLFIKLATFCPGILSEIYIPVEEF